MMLFKEAISQRILDLCKQYNYSPNKLAEMSAIPPSTLRAMLSNSVDNPSSYLIFKICRTLKIDVKEFYNSNLFNLKDIMSSFGLTLKEVSIDTCINSIKKLNQPLNAHLMNDLISSEYIEVPFSASITNNRLHDLSFDWPKIDKSYLSNLYHLILQI